MPNTTVQTLKQNIHQSIAAKEELLQQEDEKNLFDKMRELFTRFLKK